MAGGDKLVFKWAAQPSEKDYEGALNYLTLKYDSTEAKGLLADLRAAKVVRGKFRAMDILRACRLKPLEESDPNVLKERNNLITKGSLRPILIVSYPVWSDIADGYHRTSLVYWEDPEETLDAKVVHYEPLDF